MWAMDERGIGWEWRALAVAAACCWVMAPAGARCVDEDQLVEEFGNSAVSKPAAESPRQQLQAMVRDALQRSAAVGASRLLADAAMKDLEETAAGRQPSANFTGTLGLAGAMNGSVTQYNGLRALGTVSAGAPLMDNGRQDKLQEWRTQLADAARAGEITAQEQVVLQTVSLALERNRYRVQMAVYQQYARKTACLVEALEQITQADKGRASELVQARKTHEQVRISLERRNRRCGRTRPACGASWGPTCRRGRGSPRCW
jgi:outer membrane protein TolC